MNYEITLEQTYPYPPQRVWRALTESAALAEWLMPNDFLPKIGHKFQFRTKPMGDWRGFVDCEVIELVHEKKLTITWLGDADWKEQTIVRWTLDPIAGGTRLRLEHSNLQEPWGKQLQGMLAQGWKKMLEEKILRAIEHLDS